MSWNKNTINLSRVDSFIEVLNILKEPYSIAVLKRVTGRGLNDGAIFGEERIYDLRRLGFKDKVMLEKITQTADCDSDDIISSELFDWNDEPIDWKWIIQEED
jgi:hypothetical protein